MSSLSSTSERKHYQDHDNYVLGPVLNMDIVYKRTISNPRLTVGKKFVNLYGNEKNMEGYMFSSGMNAIMIALKTVIKQKGYNGTFLYGNELYGDTMNKIIPELAKENLDVNFISFDVRDTKEFDNLIDCHRNTLIGLFVESASNPSGYMFDWSLIKKHGRLFGSGQVSIIVDNTWLSSAMFNPFIVGANIVVESCSKYNSGGNVIGGVSVVQGKKVISTMRSMISTYGIHVSEDVCEIISHNLDSLYKRVKEITDKTYTITNIINKNLSNEEVCSIGLSDHPSHSLFLTHCPNHKTVGVFTLRIDSDATGEDLANACYSHNILYATSFGKSEELIDMWPVKNKGSLTIRVSIGTNTNQSDFINKLHHLYSDLMKIKE